MSTAAPQSNPVTSTHATTTPAETTPTGWDEPSGTTARGTVVILTGRGETISTYQRLGRRLAVDAYRVRVVTTDLDDVTATRERVEKLLADEALPAPMVVLGSDAGATLLSAWASSLPIDALILAGLAWGSAPTPASWDDELEVRTACPVHRQVLAADEAFERGAYTRPLDWTEPITLPPRTPTLILHGSADRITPVAELIGTLNTRPTTRVRIVRDGRHDILNDAMHRSVAATIVLFLESLRLGADVPDIVSALVPTPAVSAAGGDR